MEIQRESEVITQFNKVGEGITEDEFYSWIDTQPDSDEIYAYFSEMIQEFKRNAEILKSK